MDEDERALNDDPEDVDDEEDYTGEDYDSEPPSDEDEEEEEDLADSAAEGDQTGVNNNQDDLASNRTPKEIPYPRFKELLDDNKQLRESHGKLLDAVTKLTGQKPQEQKQDREDDILSQLEGMEPLGDGEDLLRQANTKLLRENSDLKQRVEAIEQMQQQVQVDRALSQFENVTAKLAKEAGIELDQSDKQKLLNSTAAFGKMSIDQATRIAFRDIFYDRIVDAKLNAASGNRTRQRKERLGGSAHSASPGRGTKGAEEEPASLHDAIVSSIREVKGRKR
ncbi:MAG: hypothetical protein ABFD83_13855 [Armatimonadota bacterium]